MDSQQTPDAVKRYTEIIQEEDEQRSLRETINGRLDAILQSKRLLEKELSSLVGTNMRTKIFRVDDDSVLVIDFRETTGNQPSGATIRLLPCEF